MYKIKKTSNKWNCNANIKYANSSNKETGCLALKKDYKLRLIRCKYLKLYIQPQNIVERMWSNCLQDGCK